MNEKNFILTELRILPECNKDYLKVLKANKYAFNQLEIHNRFNESHIEKKIFGKQVFIQTIVGKNGSGKSSLLELIYRVVNNYSYYILLLSKPKRVAAEPIFLIEGLYIDLDFVIDDVKCSLMVRDKSVGIINGDNRLFFGPQHLDFKEFQDYNKKPKQTIVSLASSFFYTIVTNYSFQSLINQDFDEDIAKEFVDSKGTGFSSGGNWLNSLFRKNDGYITPIVLNPYREDGKIDLSKEYYLTLSRISALLIEAEQKGNILLTGYRLSTIRYTADSSHFIHKLFKKYNASDRDIWLSEILLALSNPKTIASYIIKTYSIRLHKITEIENVIPYAYLIYKTLSILGKYPQYEDFENIPEIIDFKEEIEEEVLQSLTSAIADIISNRSHVNNKIFQTINYLNSYSEHLNDFILEDYLPYKSHEKFKDLENITENLPPPYYKQEIILHRVGKENDPIQLSKLSSGERQFIYTISTIVYHIKNLLSIQQVNRIRYRNINIVLDEVEICFHPEYQRQFINWFLELIDRLNLTRNCSFNILLVTHSPFILSDVPKKNIMYLTDGEQTYDENLINPFAANINDILYQSFFLSGGFIGEHAKNQINSAMKVMVRMVEGKPIAKNSIWNEESIKKLIDLIGEPLLKDNLSALYDQAFQRQSVEDLLRIKDEEIQQLKDQLNKKQNS